MKEEKRKNKEGKRLRFRVIDPRCPATRRYVIRDWELKQQKR